jgi:hypothetical protein
MENTYLKDIISPPWQGLRGSREVSALRFLCPCRSNAAETDALVEGRSIFITKNI